MIFSVNSTLSAVQTFGTKMGVTANNLANVETDEFKKSRATISEGPAEGVVVEIEKVDSPGPTVTGLVDGEMKERELSNVDMAEEITEMIPTQKGYEANLTVIKTKEEMLGSIIDIIS
ncbi:MAG: flagellar basal body rod C-terminal domain-containing protein [Pseudomonadota bacterium]